MGAVGKSRKEVIHESLGNCKSSDVLSSVPQGGGCVS